MVSWLRSFWQKVKKPLEVIAIIAVCLLVIVLIVLVLLTYIFHLNVQGLTGKNLWDWLQLLIIPAVLAIGGYLFNFATSRTEREIASDRQREDALQAYIDNMSALLLEKDLRKSGEEDEVRTIARVRTLTVLPRLDGVRKRSVLQFLYESNLIDKGQRIVDLDGADLRGADLHGADLHGAELTSTDLGSAILYMADIRYSKLIEANLYAARIIGADLSRASMIRADLRGAYLMESNMQEVDLMGANLIEAFMGRANLQRAHLSAVNLQDAELSGVNLARATGITNEELEKQARSLEGATMPDGTKHA